jgi:hypothetical protein
MLKRHHILLYIGIGALLFISAGLTAQTVPEQGLQSITPQEMRDHVYYLASDRMQGRDTPSPELDSCAAYIAREFASCGLRPAGPGGTYFQTFNLLKTRLSEPNAVTLIANGTEKSYRLKNDFVPLHVTANLRLEKTPVVFAGYGITAPEYKYDDYRNIDASGKVVFIFTGEPQAKDSASVFSGASPTDYSKLHMKVENALDHGAVGIIVVTTPNRRFRRPPNSWPSLMRNAPANAVPLTVESKTGSEIVAVQAGRALADDLLTGSGRTLEELYNTIDASLTPQSMNLENVLVSMETNLAATIQTTQNVAGLWEGSDPELKNELVIIGGHYDHVGVSNGEIYNGADDNASGTTGVLEVAEAFAQSPERPRRSILFMAFAGEEKGLFGSRYYTANPLFPLEGTVTMLNMDMISRNDTNQIAIVASKSSTDLNAINEACNKKVGLTLLYDSDRFFTNSDHYPFYRKKIPVLFYFSKPTPDLHKPTDDPDKIIPEKMAIVGRLVFSTAWTVANRTERPLFTGTR